MWDTLYIKPSGVSRLMPMGAMGTVRIMKTRLLNYACKGSLPKERLSSPGVKHVWIEWCSAPVHSVHPLHLC